MKTVITHIAPDVDAVTSVWLLKKFLPGWEEAEIKFVPAGKTLDNQIVDSDPEIWHVDTGMGILDHHQTDEDTCAAKRTMELIAREAGIKDFPDEALERLVEVVNDIDHFREVEFPQPESDYYDFGMVAVLDGWKLIYAGENEKIARMGMMMLDGIYRNFQNKVWAEKEIERLGYEFVSPWGKGIALETVNDEAIRVAQRKGYAVAVRKDPNKGYIRVKASPNSGADLTACYNIYRKKDPEATWFLHASRKMVLNGSIKNPESKASKLTLRETVAALETKKND